MKLNRTWVLVTICVVAACGVVYPFMREEFVTKPTLRGQLSQKFKDPSSLQFQRETVTATGWICGEVNAKNSYGAYDGFIRYITDGDQVFIDKPEFANTASTDEIITLLNHQNTILRKILTDREARPNTAAAPPTEAQTRAAAWTEVFEEKWLAVCTT